MKKKRIIIVLIVVGIFVSIIGRVCFLGYQEVVLRKEINRVMALPVKEQMKKQEIECRGKYASVEKAIKKYVVEYDKTFEAIDEILNEEKIGHFTSTENMMKDKPEFSQTKAEIKQLREEWSDLYQKFTYLFSEEGMFSFLEQDLENYYVNLYAELMESENGVNISKESLLVEDMNKFVNNMLNIQENMIDLLIENAGEWNIENNEIHFNDEKVEKEYWRLVNQMLDLE